MRIINYIFTLTYLFNFVKGDVITTQTNINLITNRNLINIKNEIEKEVEANFQKYLDYSDNKLLNFIPVVINKQNIDITVINNASDHIVECIYNNTINIRTSSNRLTSDGINLSIRNIKPQILFDEYYQYICSYNIDNIKLLDFKLINKHNSSQNNSNISGNLNKKHIIILSVIVPIVILLILSVVLYHCMMTIRDNQQTIEMIINNNV